MSKDEFLATISAGIYAEIVTVTREADAFLETHSHHFDARALVLRGELKIRIADIEHLYRAGDVFQIPARCEHSERYGPQGGTYLAARK